MIKKYREAREEYVPKYIEITEENDGIVTVHLYDIVEDHTATADWYEIDRNTAKGTTLFGDDIDLNDLTK